MNGLTYAFLASLCFGVLIFPWNATLDKLGSPAVFLFMGAIYLVAGGIWYAISGFKGPLTGPAVRTAIAMSVVYLAAIIFCNLALSDKAVKMTIVTAITAGYPVFTAALAFLLLRKGLSARELFFFMMSVVGLVGMALSSRPP